MYKDHFGAVLDARRLPVMFCLGGGENCKYFGSCVVRSTASDTANTIEESEWKQKANKRRTLPEGADESAKYSVRLIRRRGRKPPSHVMPLRWKGIVVIYRRGEI